jgi:hypothetical protein
VSGGRLREVAGALLALLIALLASIVVTWPMIQYLDTVVLGGGELGGWLWRYDWHFRSLEGLMQADMGPVSLWREFVGLGRHPETGNILDVLAFNYPLERTVGFPASYNLKILIVLVGNGLCGYALGRYFSGSVSAGLAASAVAVVNPITTLEIQASGLRQALLWWVLLYPPLLDRALRRRTVGAGLAAGTCFGMAGAFYWFYGLFTALFSVAWFLKHVISERARLDPRGLARAVGGVVVGTLLLAGPFVLPYAMPVDSGAGAGGAASGGTRSALPEMTFFLPYPAFDTVMSAPLRPQTYAENILASINRTVASSWSATYPVDPTLNESLPLTVRLVGVLPALTRRRSWGWLAIWLFFYVGTLGPFLRVGAGDSRDVVRLFDDQYVVRLPYTTLFQFVPGMSRMFAPYRLGAYVMVASTALVAIGLARFRWRAWAAPVVILATVAQPMYRWDKGSVNEGGSDSRDWRSPVKANRIRVPDFYKELGQAGELAGIVELPLEQQQDLLCYYQVVHGQKVYRSWASSSAVPPSLRPQDSGGEPGARLRYQARADVVSGPVPSTFEGLSRDPENVDLSRFTADAFRQWARSGDYRRIIVHERGYYLVDPQRGLDMYSAAVRRIGQALGVSPVEIVEIVRGDPTAPEFGVPISGDLVPWTSQPLVMAEERSVGRFHMSVFEIGPAASDPRTADGASEPAPAELDTPVLPVD